MLVFTLVVRPPSFLQLVRNVALHEREPPVGLEEGLVSHRILRKSERELSGDTERHHGFGERGCIINRLGGCRGKMFKINRNVSLASAFPSERLGVGFEETLVGGFPVTLMRVESVHGRIRHVALRAEEKRGRVQRKTEDQRREPFKRDYRLRTQVVRVLEPMNKIWGKLDPLDVLANVVRKIARGQTTSEQVWQMAAWMRVSILML